MHIQLIYQEVVKKNTEENFIQNINFTKSILYNFASLYLKKKRIKLGSSEANVTIKK